MTIDSSILSVLVGIFAGLAGWIVWKFSPFFRRLVTVEGNSPSRYPMLDGLRGQLALGVFVAHAYNGYMLYGFGIPIEESNNRFFVFLGSGAVAQFFVITGFLFWGKAIEKKVGLLNHYYSRAWRIGPLFLTLAAVVVAFAAVQTDFSLKVPLPKLLGQVGSLLALGALATPFINGVDTLPFLGQAWTLRSEWRFYLVLPFVVFLATPRRLAAVCVGVFVWALVVHFSRHDRQLENNRHFAMFFVGMAVAHLVRYRPAIPLLKSFWVSLLILPVAVLAGLVTEFSPLWIPLHALIFIPIVYGNSMFGLLATRSYRTLGVISYSVYMLHRPIIQAFDVELAYYGILSRLTLLEYWLAVGLLTLPLVVLCTITYRFIEHPHLHKRLRKGPIPPPAAMEVVKPTVPLAPLSY